MDITVSQIMAFANYIFIYSWSNTAKLLLILKLVK